MGSGGRSDTNVPFANVGSSTGTVTSGSEIEGGDEGRWCIDRNANHPLKATRPAWTASDAAHVQPLAREERGAAVDVFCGMLPHKHATERRLRLGARGDSC